MMGNTFYIINFLNIFHIKKVEEMHYPLICTT